MRTLLRFLGRWLGVGLIDAGNPRLEGWVTSPVYAAQRRERIATALLAAHVAGTKGMDDEATTEREATRAVEFADQLITALDAPPTKY